MKLFLLPSDKSNWLLFLGETHHAVNLSKPRIVFVSKPNFEKVAKINQQNEIIEKIILIDNIYHNTVYDKVITFKQLVDDTSIPPIGEFQCQPQNMKDNVALILCSSGTTGLPKGVQLTQFGVIAVTFQEKYA